VGVPFSGVSLCPTHLPKIFPYFPILSSHALYPIRVTQELIRKSAELRALGKTIPEIAEALGKSKSSVMLYLNPTRLQAHRDRNKAYQKHLLQTDPQRVYAASLKWAQANRDKVNARQRRYWQENKEWKRQYQRDYYHALFQKDPSKHQALLLRCALCNWMKGHSKKRRDGLSVAELVGCTLEQFRAHLEAKFTGAMSWSTYGKEWELDHIEPLFTFNLLDLEQVRKAFHYSNTRPLHPSLNRGRERREHRMGFPAPYPQ
jgi:hypothetical protein